MEQNKKVPAIRFNGFEDEWEEKKLGNIVYRLDNLRKPVKASERISGNIPYYGANGIQDFVDGYTHDGEFVLLAEDGANDLKKYPIQYVKGKIWVNNHAHVIQGIVGEVENLFLKNTLLKTDFEQIIVGGSRSKLNATTMMNIKINSAKTLTEQTQIGNFFKTLDSQITSQEQKHQKLINLKKAMIERMFPKEGADVPEIRFKGFTEKWEEKKLGDVANISGGGTPSTSMKEYWNGDINWFSPTEIGNSIYAYDSNKKITKLGLEKSSAKILPANKTILFTSRAGIGDMAILKKEAATNQGFQSLVVNNNFDVYFIFSLGKSIKKKAITKASGSTFLEISGKTLGLLSFKFPSLEEQQKIGEYFEKLDNLIQQSQEQIEKYKNIKQALLQKMFV